MAFPRRAVLRQFEEKWGNEMIITTSQFYKETEDGERFSFGDNWKAFLLSLNDKKIEEAENSLKEMLEIENLQGKRFLDVGSGSGLFSLAARRLGAEVFSFDYDPSSVWCTMELRKRYFQGDKKWIIQQGSALDQPFLSALGKFDIVYSWGVLHHTGDLWTAAELIVPLVKADGGKIFIAIYNDQGRKSKAWRVVKKTYCQLPVILKPLVLYPVGLIILGPGILRDFIKLKPFDTLRKYYLRRGMSPWRDIVDWVGGYPYEVAKPEEVFDFFRNRGCALCRLKTMTGFGNNQFVFELKE
jgi:2-polyprenyl-3-methyl-5-hydroxy-6-metoxy-1,4-benzoquinol methylase